MWGPENRAFDFVTKPVQESRLIATIGQAMERRALFERLAEFDETGETGSFEGMIGASAAMQSVYRAVESVAPTDASVLIRGGSGTGKELLARAIHRRSSRRSSPFVALDMAALPTDLVESALFGHERGSFTGAVSQPLGACEEAAGGTLFLDEIGEMQPELQAKLLRFLEEGTFRRVGGSGDVHSDTRILSAPNRQLGARVLDGTFREDLFYRLNVVPIELPDLVAREGDLSLLAHHAMRVMNRRHGRQFSAIDATAMEFLRRHAWPGNVRELFHVIERIVIVNDVDTITAGMLPPEIRAAEVRTTNLAEPVTPQSAQILFPDTILPFAEIEKRAIEQALRVSKGSVPAAAKGLELSPATIYRKLKIFGIDRLNFVR